MGIVLYSVELLINGVALIATNGEFDAGGNETTFWGWGCCLGKAGRILRIANVLAIEKLRRAEKMKSGVRSQESGVRVIFLFS
jgi:hypothetical protein